MSRRGGDASDHRCGAGAVPSRRAGRARRRRRLAGSGHAHRQRASAGRVRRLVPSAPADGRPGRSSLQLHREPAARRPLGRAAARPADARRAGYPARQPPRRRQPGAARRQPRAGRRLLREHQAAHAGRAVPEARFPHVPPGRPRGDRRPLRVPGRARDGARRPDAVGAQTHAHRRAARGPVRVHPRHTQLRRGAAGLRPARVERDADRHAADAGRVRGERQPGARPDAGGRGPHPEAPPRCAAGRRPALLPLLPRRPRRRAQGRQPPAAAPHGGPRADRDPHRRRARADRRRRRTRTARPPRLGGRAGGRLGVDDHAAWAYAVETGYQLPTLAAAPWLRVGYDRSSGDGNPGDGHHRTFFQLLPTARTYAQLPFYNLMNTADAFAQVLLVPHRIVSLRADYHWLTVSDGNDLWYSGGGATNDHVFGYAGSPAGGRHALAQVIDLSVTVQLLRQLALGTYYGHAFGGDVVRETFAGTGANYGFVELVYRR